MRAGTTERRGDGRRATAGATTAVLAAVFARRARAAMAVALAAGALVAAQAATASPARAAGTVHGCPSGYVCIYPENRGWNGDRPSLRFYTYGAHNLRNQYGLHRVFNNQYGDAYVSLCRGYNGTGGGVGVLGSPHAYDFNLTPVNSIELTPPSSFGC